jgi:hypothetical protein
MSRTVQIVLSNEEYEQLEREANQEGLTVPLYVKGVALGDNEFSRSYKKLIQKVAQLPSGTRFTIKAVFGTDWTMGKGVKLSLGKTFYQRVEDGTVPNVVAEGKDSSNVMWYMKL